MKAIIDPTITIADTAHINAIGIHIMQVISSQLASIYPNNFNNAAVNVKISIILNLLLMFIKKYCIS